MRVSVFEFRDSGEVMLRNSVAYRVACAGARPVGSDDCYERGCEARVDSADALHDHRTISGR